ncbi:hypothetical protein RF11_05943 [Thelohanellus kitauei]|uniref:Uncharacterized protein n=1 Tax=Thelohanellus kitauei TaxID=669202 RepID=A0A0C2MI82_THEKT|nr:hypothetical protein RF11_05943 [Thelohanellus kitauei]
MNRYNCLQMFNPTFLGCCPHVNVSFRVLSSIGTDHLPMISVVHYSRLLNTHSPLLCTLWLRYQCRISFMGELNFTRNIKIKHYLLNKNYQIQTCKRKTPTFVLNSNSIEKLS